MHKVLLPLIVLAGCFTCVSSASAGTWYTKKVIAGSSVYVRSAPEAFDLGILMGGENFTYNTDNTSGVYRFGHARGNAHKCGWVNINYFQSTATVYNSDCNSGHYSVAVDVGSRQFLRGLYARCVNDYVPALPGGGSGPNNVAPFFLDTTSGSYSYLTNPTHLWGNYTYGSEYCTWPQLFSYQFGVNTTFAWRWVSDNRGVVLGKMNSTWGFVPRYCLPDKLRYADWTPQNLRERDDWEAGL